jgi:hypothetical protein
MILTQLFYSSFADWLDECLESPISTPAAGFRFSLTLRGSFTCLKLAGTSEFDESGSLWTWSEFWNPAPDPLILPVHLDRPELRTLISQALECYLLAGLYRQRLLLCDGIALDITGSPVINLFTSDTTIVRQHKTRLRLSRRAVRYV